MKNGRAILVLAVIAIVGGLGLYQSISWYHSGRTPAGPASFFDAGEVERCIRRLESFRLPVPEAVQLCRAVTNHLAHTESVNFLNPPSAVGKIQKLQRELSSLKTTHAATVDQMETGRSGRWSEAFRTFVDQSGQAHNDALSLARILAKADWQDHSFALLRNRVIEGKSLCSRCLDFPPWQSNGELRRHLYPAFETAYLLRDESNQGALHAELIAPNPPVLRWFYATRYASQVGVPTPLCEDPLRREADRLDQFAADVRDADPTDVLADWHFPEARAANLRDLASIVHPLEHAQSFEEFLEALENQQAAVDALITRSQADADPPDPAVKIRALAFRALYTTLEPAVQHMRNSLSLPAFRYLIQAVRRLEEDGKAFTDCVTDTLSPVIAEADALEQAYEALAAVPLSAPTEELAGAVERVVDSARRSGNLLGVNFQETAAQNAVDAWGSKHWPGVGNADRMGEQLIALNAVPSLQDPRLEEAGHFIRRLADESSVDLRAEMAQEWDQGLRDRAAAYPLLVHHMDESLGDLHRIATVQEIRQLIDEQDWERLRAAADDVLASDDLPEGSKRREELNALVMILDLPGNRDKIDLRHLDRLHETNRSRIPGPPGPGSMHRDLYVERVQPIIRYAESISRIDDATSRRTCQEWIFDAWQARDKMAEIYGPWQALDREFAERIAFRKPACVPTRPADLFRLVDLLDEQRTWSAVRPEARDAIELQSEALATLAELLQSEPAAEGLADRIAAVRDQLQRITPLPAESGAVLAQFEARAQFEADMTSLPNSYQALQARIRKESRAASPISRPYLKGYVEGIAALQPIVERDMHMVGGNADISSLLQTAAAYADAAIGPAMPDRLEGYATDQAVTLRHYVKTSDYALHPAPGGVAEAEDLTIPRRKIAHALGPLGYGRRSRGQGDGFTVWIRSGQEKASIFEGDWEEQAEDGLIQVRDLRAAGGAVPWSWGLPIDVGVSILHTTNDNRNIVPDSGGGRSRWNPLNYGVFRVETNDYQLARYSSLEMFVREYLVSVTEDRRLILALDPLFADAITLEEPSLRFMLEGIPRGRDLDWPEHLEPLGTNDILQLREEVESSISNLVESLMQ